MLDEALAPIREYSAAISSNTRDGLRLECIIKPRKAEAINKK
jgi:hypothetical protein